MRAFVGVCRFRARRKAVLTGRVVFWSFGRVRLCGCLLAAIALLEEGFESAFGFYSSAAVRATPRAEEEKRRRRRKCGLRRRRGRDDFRGKWGRTANRFSGDEVTFIPVTNGSKAIRARFSTGKGRLQHVNRDGQI